MSRWGHVKVECESDDCYALVMYEADDLRDVCVDERMTEDGWNQKDGLDYCPVCSKPENPRERGDDDGVEYGHPGDHLKGLE